MSLTYAIGDAHGRFDLVHKALQMADEHAEESPYTFVCCGDFIDRGPGSVKIIERFMYWEDKPGSRLIVLRGNHEQMMIEGVENPVLHGRFWCENGGANTLIEYGAKEGDSIASAVKRVPASHITWLKTLSYFHIDQHRAFVHAGFDPHAKLEEQSPRYMMWVRDDKRRDYSFEGRHVVHGHEQYAEGPILNKNKTNLDVWAHRFGRLAVAVFADDKPGGPIDILWAEE